MNATAATGHQHAAARSAHYRRALGPAGVVVVAMFTVVALSGDLRIGAGAVSVTAMTSGAIALACWTLVLLYDRAPAIAARATVIYLAFLAWTLGSLLLDGTTKQGVQFILVQFAFAGAILLTATARNVIGPYLDEVVARCVRITALTIMIVEVIGTIEKRLSFNVRPLAIVALIGLGWFVAEYRTGRRSAGLWALAVYLCIVITLSRTATLAGFVLILLMVVSGADRRRARNAALAALLLVGGYVAVTSWAPLRDRFTHGDTSLSVGGVSINAEGRTHVWHVLWSEALQDPIIGRGAGSASARSLEVSSTLDHPHNDYLRVFYDFGLIGIALLAWFAARATRLLLWTRRRVGSVASSAALYAGLAVIIVMATDNPLDYSFVMIPLGALIGLAFGNGAYPSPRPGA
jgi:hypothetical protein